MSSSSIFISVSPTKLNDIAIISKSPTGDETILTNSDLLQSKNKGRVQIRGSWIRVTPSYRNADSFSPDRLSIPSLLALVVPTSTLIGCIIAFFLTDATGWEAVFPSFSTAGFVWKLTVWGTLVSVVAHEHSFYWYGSLQSNGPPTVGLEVMIEHRNGSTKTRSSPHNDNLASPESADSSGISIDESINSVEVVSRSRSIPEQEDSQPTKKDTSDTATASNQAEDESSSSPNKIPAPTHSKDTLPFRFIRAEKGDITSAKKRWVKTLQWREELGMDTILNEPHQHIKLIKANYPHYFHLRGRGNECCYYEKPPKMDLKTLKGANIQLEELLRHYAMCCEYMWSAIETSEDGKSIYVIDLEGIGFRDFAGEVVDFVKKATSFTSAHYPERSGSIFVINVPSWFSVIWNVVRPMVDDVTKKKIKILRSGKDAITKALVEKIPIENIPPEYGGQSMPLGQSPEELEFMNHFDLLNNEKNG